MNGTPQRGERHGARDASRADAELPERAPGTDSILKREIAEQGDAVAATAAGAEAVAAAARAVTAPDVSHIVIAGRGSSDNAARFGQYLLGSELRIGASLAAPWLYKDPDRAPRLGGAALLAISQSGQSPDIVAVLAAGRLQGRPTVAITADVDSPLAQHADVVVALQVTERSVAATKTYTATLATLVRITNALSPDPVRERWLTLLPRAVDETARELLDSRARFDALLGVPLLTVTGRGLAYSAACETALKVRELAGMTAEAFSPPDLMHGPVAALDGRGAIWSIEPACDVIPLIERAAASVVIGGPPRAWPAATIRIPLPTDAPPWVRSLVAVIAGQVAGLRLAERLAVDIDSPHGLHKVTLTS